ncbi:Organic cation transporter protein [Operophtera brumata]|uniref:Organic cation transporter protein n=1 Tax=Operophtera brumata TaxID=104452 RepID=A0A0L7KX97_OPEBR|nr:Organic cation transporter protein [Operophtera brumata]
MSNKATNDVEERAHVDYDELLSSAGELGRYQVLLCVSTAPFYMFGVFVYFSQLFMTEVSANHWCWIPQLQNLTEVERINLAIPADVNSRYGYSQCQAYVANWTEILSTGKTPDETWQTAPCQDGWEFDKSEIPYPTITSEMGWVCDKNSYQATAQAIFFIGSTVGGFTIGWIADRFGRLPALVASNLLGCIGGLLSTFARNFIQFSICRFIMGMAHSNCMLMAYLIALEYVAPKHRTLLTNMTFSIFFSAFAMSLPWIALACGHWKTISLVTSLPLGFAIFAPLFIPESPRWLLSKGRIDEAIEKIRVIGRINRKEVPMTLIEQFKETLSKEHKDEMESCLAIFKRPVLRRSLILACLEFMCCTIVFDGLFLNIGQLNFDFFLSFSVISFTEFPSVFLLAFILDWLGRRWLIFIMMAVSCVFCVVTVFMNSGVESVVCAVIARFGVNMSYSAIMQWAAELLPTSVRGSGTTFVHICGYFATILTPYIVYLKIFAHWLPLVIIGAIAGFGGVIALFLPETANKEMPHTFDEAEGLSRNQKFWDIPCLRRKQVHLDGQVNQSFEN